MKEKIYVLVACEESQAETIAFRELGAVAFSCDLQPCRKGTPAAYHIVGDVTPYLNGTTRFVCQDGVERNVPRWDLIIAHPPCTYLCRLSSYWLRKDANLVVEFRGKKELVNEQRYNNMISSRKFFFTCLNANSKYLAVENPQPMAMAELPAASCYVDPSWYGHKYTKKTLYWLKNLPPLMPEIIYPGAVSFVGRSRGKYRSRTFKGVAQAMAKQWLRFIEDNQ